MSYGFHKHLGTRFDTFANSSHCILSGINLLFSEHTDSWAELGSNNPLRSLRSLFKYFEDGHSLDQVLIVPILPTDLWGISRFMFWLVLNAEEAGEQVEILAYILEGSPDWSEW